MFERAAALSRRHEELVEGLPGANPVASAVIEERIDQLDLIVQMIRARQEEMRTSLAGALATGGDREAASHVHQLHAEAQLLGEAFYYFANGLVTLIEKNPLPHLQRVDAGQIGFVRNRLVEHFHADPMAPFARVSVLGVRGPRFSRKSRDMTEVSSSGDLFDTAEKFAILLGAHFERAVTAAERDVGARGIAGGDDGSSAST